jgi:hypothetical protein
MKQLLMSRQSKRAPGEYILAEARSWLGVHTQRHRYGGTALYHGRRELGHLHGDSVADLPLPRALRDHLVAAEPAVEHRWRPDSGWVTIALDSDRDVFEVLALLRANYERGLAASERREAANQARWDRGQPGVRLRREKASAVDEASRRT